MIDQARLQELRAEHYGQAKYQACGKCAWCKLEHALAGTEGRNE